MNYEINVSKLNSRNEYVHYLATADRSISTIDKLKIILNDFMTMYPEPEYKISVSSHYNVGKTCSAIEFLNNPNCFVEII